MEFPGHKEFFEFKEEMLKYIDSIIIPWPNEDLSHHFHDLVDYTISGGKCHRGLLSVYGFLELTGFDPKSEEAKPGYALGWIQEIIQASFLVADDLMDHSELRRGKPCWYKKDNNGYSAVSDSYFLENLSYLLLDHYFEGYPSQTKHELQSLIHETVVRTSIGQFIDNSPKEPTLDNWNLTVTSKTSYYSIWQPFVSGMCASTKVPKEDYRNEELKQTLLHAGRLFQCQDDWIDIYGSVAKTGKMGTDIQDGKCTWLFAKAMEIANEDQKRVLKENVGKVDANCVNKVREMYQEFDIEKLVIQHHDQMYKELLTMFEKLGRLVPNNLKAFLVKFLDRRNY